jgi:hypothetical protein
VLVQHRLRHAGALGDLVHGGGVVALRDEHLERSVQQLGAARAPRHPPAPGRDHRGSRGRFSSSAARGAGGDSVGQRCRLGHRGSVPTGGTPPGALGARGIIGEQRAGPTGCNQDGADDVR